MEECTLIVREVGIACYTQSGLVQSVASPHPDFVIDRRFYRRKYDVRKTFEAFSAKLRGETDLDAASGELTSVVMDTMQPVHLWLWLRSDTSRNSE
jgi:hypothetical protein